MDELWEEKAEDMAGIWVCKALHRGLEVGKGRPEGF
jgi:hypothetical protein